jgi:hypothetical protein
MDVFQVDSFAHFHLGMNSEAHSSNPLKRVEEAFGLVFQSVSTDFTRLASEFIPRWGRSINLPENCHSSRSKAFTDHTSVPQNRLDEPLAIKFRVKTPIPDRQRIGEIPPT